MPCRAVPALQARTLPWTACKACCTTPAPTAVQQVSGGRSSVPSQWVSEVGVMAEGEIV